MTYVSNFIRCRFHIITISFFCLSSLLLIAFPHPFFFIDSFSTNAQQQQPFTLKDLVTYNRQSDYIKEYKIPLVERGLKGIITDPHGNAWFYHSTNKSTTIIKLDPTSNKFTQYDVKGDTTVDNFIINLAGGQLVFDNVRNVLWFTDARTNSIGRLDLKNNNNNNSGDSNSSKVELINIPTPKSGPMGIALSPDGKSVWFAEITGDKIARLDIESNKILEYPTGENTGPTFVTFDSKGVLWVTMSYSHNVLRVEPWALIPGRSSFGMSTTALPKPDMISPFGIAVVGSTAKTATTPGVQKMFVSDHGSSRVISSSGDINSNPFQSYTSYWTSPSQVYPTTLPGQIVKDKSENNIYFPEHGGNRISKISIGSGEMTEYDIPTGPLSTTLFIAVSDDGKRVWFTEWASNKVAFLDMTVPVPFSMKINNNNNNNNNSPVLLKANEPKTLYALLNANKNASSLHSFPLSLTEVEIAVIGMSNSGLKGVSYTANPQRFDLDQNPVNKSQINLNVEQDQARSGQYTAMIKASASEKKDPLLFVSLLYPIPLTVDVPTTISQQHQPQDNSQFPFGSELLRNMIRFLALPAAIGLIAFTIYKRIKRSKRQIQKR